MSVYKCYTGMPRIREEQTPGELNNLINLSHMFQLPELETICINIMNEEEDLNPSIVSYINYQTGKQMKSMLLNKKLLSDVVFVVEGGSLEVCCMFFLHKTSCNFINNIYVDRMQ